MQINYLILAHKNLLQLDRLISVLDHDKTRFFIHIDKKVRIAEIKKYKFCLNERVTLIKNRIQASWGAFSLITATLKLMRAASAHSKGYFILLSGEDFPLQTNEYIYNFLSNSYGKEYLHYMSLPCKDWRNGGLDRINYYWFDEIMDLHTSSLFIAFQKKHEIKRPNFVDFPYYGGSQWWCLSHDCILYILKFIHHNSIILERFKFCLVPDEMIFQTILLNSPFKKQIINDNLKYIVFEENKPRPRIYDKNDFTTLVQSEKLWARKFDINYDSVILDKIESHINTLKLNDKILL